MASVRGEDIVPKVVQSPCVFTHAAFCLLKILHKIIFNLEYDRVELLSYVFNFVDISFLENEFFEDHIVEPSFELTLCVGKWDSLFFHVLVVES